MTPIATALKHMLAAGMPADAIVAAVAEMEAALAPVADPVITRKRERDRERMRERRRATSRDSRDESDVAAGPPALPPSPQTPQPPTHTPPDITTRAKATPLAKPNGFARFWEAYPNKVGRAAAEKSYAKACVTIGGPDPPSVLLEGLERAKRSRAWSEGYIPHPTTWLNQGRWDDQPATLRPVQSHERPDHHDRNAAREDSLRAHHAGAMAALNRRVGSVG